MQDLADRFYMTKAAIALKIEMIKKWMDRFEGIDLEVNRINVFMVHGNERKKRAYCAQNGTIYAFKSLPLPIV